MYARCITERKLKFRSTSEGKEGSLSTFAREDLAVSGETPLRDNSLQGDIVPEKVEKRQVLSVRKIAKARPATSAVQRGTTSEVRERRSRDHGEEFGARMRSESVDSRIPDASLDLNPGSRQITESGLSLPPSLSLFLFKRTLQFHRPGKNTMADAS